MKFSRASFFTSAIASVAIFLQSATPASAVLPSYNLGADFSDVSNPGSRWSYNVGGSPIGSHTTMWWGTPAWCYVGNIGDGAIWRGAVPVGLDPYGNNCVPNDWQAGDVVMAALSIPYGGDSSFLSTTWTSPLNGTISISGKAWDSEMFADRDVAWSLLINGQSIAGRSSTFGLFRTDAAADFANNLLPGKSLTDISINAGDVVEFRVMTDTYYGHMVGVDETIAFTSVIPEPGTFSLLAMGAIGLGIMRRQLKA